MFLTTNHFAFNNQIANNKTAVPQSPVPLKLDDNNKFILNDEETITSSIIEAEKENELVVESTPKTNKCKGIPFHKLQNLVDQNGYLIINGKQYGGIGNNDTNACIRLNDCSGKNLNKNGICEQCYRIYRNNLKVYAYRKNKALEVERSEAQKLKMVCILNIGKLNTYINSIDYKIIERKHQIQR